MAIAWSVNGTHTFATNSITPVMPAHAAGNMLLAVWIGKAFDAGVSVTGWTDIGSGSSGTTAAGIDLGSMKMQVWWKEAASAAETAPTFTEGTPTWNMGGGCVIVWTKGGSETWDAPVVVYGADEDLGANVSTTMASDPGVTSGDGVQILFAVCSDTARPATAGPTCTQTGVTFGTVTKDVDSGTTSGGDAGVINAHCLATAGTGSAAPVIGATTPDPGDPRWEGGFVRLRVSTPAATPSLLYQPNPRQYILVR